MGDRLRPGARIGDYVVERELRVEEAGVVYVGTHVVLPRVVELKVMHVSWSRTMAVQMLREACLLEALDRDRGVVGVPRVYECGVLADRRPWVAFERLEGTPLSERLAGGSTLALVDVVLLVRDVTCLLRHVHARGVIHRSLTADAIVQARSGVRVRYWESAVAIDDVDRIATESRIDVAALGAIAFEALAGEPPMRGARTAEHCPAAPGELAELIDTMRVATPSSAEIFDRVRWLADTLAPAVLDAPPPPALVPTFEVRIGRTRTS
jgi:serine/threonine protein kinase